MKITDVRTQIGLRAVCPLRQLRTGDHVVPDPPCRPAPVTFIDTDAGITGVATDGDQHTIMTTARPLLIGPRPF